MQKAQRQQRPTAPMRRVLERMDEGAVLFGVTRMSGTTLFWGDNGREASLRVFALAVGLANKKLIKWNPHEAFYLITPAGRRALREGKGS